MHRPGHRREVDHWTRPVSPIMGEVWRIYTLHPFDRRHGPRGEATFQLDGYVSVTLAVVEFGREREDVVPSCVLDLNQRGKRR